MRTNPLTLTMAQTYSISLYGTRMFGSSNVVQGQSHSERCRGRSSLKPRRFCSSWTKNKIQQIQVTNGRFSMLWNVMEKSFGGDTDRLCSSLAAPLELGALLSVYILTTRTQVYTFDVCACWTGASNDHSGSAASRAWHWSSDQSRHWYWVTLHGHQQVDQLSVLQRIHRL